MSVIDIQGILQHLPHRFPFILIDRVIECEDNRHLIALKNVTINEPYFCGHFPERPVMPGVLILEAIAQACVLLAHRGEDDVASKKYLHFFAGIDNARFKQVVIPGDQLHIEAEQIGRKRDIWRMHGKVTVDGKLVCSADLMSAAKEIES